MTFSSTASPAAPATGRCRCAVVVVVLGFERDVRALLWAGHNGYLPPSTQRVRAGGLCAAPRWPPCTS